VGTRHFYQLDHLIQLSSRAYLPTRELNQGRVARLKVISRLFPQSLDERPSIEPTYMDRALAATKDPTDPIAEELDSCVALCPLDLGFYSDAEIQYQRCTALRAERKE